MFNPNQLRLLQNVVKELSFHGKKLVWWGVPAAAAGKEIPPLDCDSLISLLRKGVWLAYPALTPDFKKSVGL